jgi:hypothetical protein
MTQNLTDNPAWVANVRAPADGDPANAATFAAGHQDAADRTAYLKQQLETSQLAVIAKLTPSASSLADAGTLGLSVHLGYPSGDWNVSSNQLQVPSAGLYRVSLNALILPASDLSVIIECRVGASGVVKRFVGPIQVSPAATVMVSGETLIPITTPASEKIWLKNLSGTAISTINTYAPSADLIHELIVERIGDA